MKVKPKSTLCDLQTVLKIWAILG